MYLCFRRCIGLKIINNSLHNIPVFRTSPEMTFLFSLLCRRFSWFQLVRFSPTTREKRKANQLKRLQRNIHLNYCCLFYGLHFLHSLIFCNECTARTATIASSKKPVRVCGICYTEVTTGSIKVSRYSFYLWNFTTPPPSIL